MEFGYGAALALMLTFLLVAVVWLYVRRASRAGAMIERRSRTRRLFEVELPVLLIVLFALAPYAWMVLTSIKPAGGAVDLARPAICRERRRSSIIATLISRTSFAGNLAQQPRDRVRRRADRARVSAFRRPMHSRASAFAGRRHIDDRVSRHQHVPGRAPDHPALRADAEARAARHVPAA